MTRRQQQGIHSMKTPMTRLAALLAALSLAPAWAQTAGGDHGQHSGHGSVSAPAPSTPAAVPEPARATPAAQATTPADTGHDMAGMDHGDMQMQGGSAPADARDPHAYSGGYALGTGTYALGGTRSLHLADEHSFASVLVNRLERVHTSDSNATAYDAQAWFGRDADKLVLKAEGDVARGKLQEARTELLWGHAIASYWDTQLGLRHDSGTGPERSWLAFGVQGLAPYWFELDATAYVGQGGRTALRLGAEYELLLTQRLILQPRVELTAYGKDDEARHIGSGLSSGVAGLRLRYEINRQLAPYVGVERSAKFGRTADLVRAEGEPSSQTRWVAGVRFWF